VSKASREDISSAFRIDQSKLKVVHNGIDTDVFQPMPEVQSNPLRIMVTASADAPLKGLVYLLKSFASLLKNHPQLELVVLGKLNEDGDTIKLIDELGISESLRFVSGISTAEIVKLYAEAAIVVVPSIYEGFGLPAGEAMACGKPVISTNGGALPEVVGDCGILIPTRDSAAITDAIEGLLANPKKGSELGKQARCRIVNLFSWKVAAEEIVTLYTSMLDEVDVKEVKDSHVTAND
jgi:glycosyltransferase involved in cell wall biosynthesis